MLCEIYSAETAGLVTMCCVVLVSAAVLCCVGGGSAVLCYVVLPVDIEILLSRGM